MARILIKKGIREKRLDRRFFRTNRSVGRVTGNTSIFLGTIFDLYEMCLSGMSLTAHV